MEGAWVLSDREHGICQQPGPSPPERYAQMGFSLHKPLVSTCLTYIPSINLHPKVRRGHNKNLKWCHRHSARGAPWKETEPESLL